MKVIELQGADNIRDLGGMAVAGSRRLSYGLMFRGSALHAITDEDRALLFDALGIRRVIDVRCGWERAEKPDRLPKDIEKLHIPFYDSEKVGLEYTEPSAGTKTVGRDVACDPPRFYASLANPLTVAQMRHALQELSSSLRAGEPVYVHCSGGKDRTGILTMLFLQILGASPEDILADYLYTNIARDKHYQEQFERFLALSDGDEEQAHALTRSHRATGEYLEIFSEAIRAHYGSMEAFLTRELGFDEAKRHELIAACTVGDALWEGWTFEGGSEARSVSKIELLAEKSTLSPVRP